MSSRASASRPAEVDRSSATDCLPAFSRSKNCARPAAGAVGTVGRLDLDHRARRRWPTGSRRGVPPTANPARRRPCPPGRARDGPRPTSDAARVGAARRRPVEPRASARDRKAEQTTALDHLGRRTSAHRRADRPPRVLGRPVELEPCRHERHVVGASERHRDPPVTGGKEAGGAPHAGGTTAVEARDRGALAQEGQGVDLELTAQCLAPPARPPRPSAVRRVTRRAGGPSGSPSGRPVSAMAPLAAQASSSTRGSSAGRRSVRACTVRQ